MAISPIRIRKDVYKLAATDKTLEWYGKAINELKKRPIKDPTSWRYQAAIHGYDRNEDPLAKPSDVLPSSADRTKFWNQCQHGSWFFLSWHRGYLLYFERILLKAIIGLGGPSDWALPYWNYSSSGTPDVKLIPPAFRPSTVGGKPNPLFAPGRTGGTSGNAGVTALDVSLDCLKRTKFVGASTGGSPGFGGPQTGFHHDPGTVGAVEATPHNNIHIAVGGYMWSFNTAGLDPLFWLHHCNIDRLWEAWRIRPASTGDPTANAWRDLQFQIHNEAGAATTFKSSAMSSTTANGYKYQDISSPPLLVPLPMPTPSILAGIEETPMAAPADTGPRPPAQLAGATDQAISLGQGKSSARVAIAPQAQSLLASVGDAQPKRVFLNIENITGKGPPGTYKVYVNVPDGENPEDYEENLVGTLALFGLGEQSAGDAAHGGSGLTFVLEVTDLVQRLQQEGSWNETDLDVDFIPLRPVPQGTDIKIGRVSVYHA